MNSVYDTSACFRCIDNSLSAVFSNMKLNIDVSETSLTMEVPAITSPRISCRQTARIDAYEKHRCIKDKVKKCFILSKMCFRQDPRTRFPSRSNIFIFEFVYFKEGRRKLSNLFIQATLITYSFCYHLCHRLGKLSLSSFHSGLPISSPFICEAQGSFLPNLILTRSSALTPRYR